MQFLSIAKVAIGMAAAAVILSACVADGPGMPPPHGRPPVEGPIMRPPPPPQSGPVCTREYAPVCGERRGQRQTFGNECVARAEGFRVVHPGECRRGGSQRPPVACTQEYRPVCAERRGEDRTFSNSCMAEAEGFRVIRPGECRPSGRPGGGRPRW